MAHRSSNRPAAPALALMPALLLAACMSPGPPPPGYRPYQPRGDQAQPAPRQQPERLRPDRPETLRVTALPAPPPAWEARTVTPDARRVAADSYIVQPGDTLRGIAEKTGAGSEAIARANGIAPPFVIRAGQQLAIPAGRYHLVRAGETGIAISRAYGIAWSRIVTANDLEEPYILRVGQRVVIPDEGPMSMEERAQAFRLDIDAIVTGGQPALAVNQAPARATSSPSRILPPGAAVAEPARLTGGFQWPVRGQVVKRFGPGASGERNDGIKIAVPLDTPVLAAADGVVAYVGSDIAALGGLVIVKHGQGWTSVYGHAGQLLVQRGQSVKKGQMIALSGNSGYADRPQLHFEMRQGRTPVDPLARLPES